MRELIVAVDEDHKRLVWSAESALLKHHNGSTQVFERGSRTCVIWTADLLPDDAAGTMEALTDAGAKAMKSALDELAGKG
ncbi:hypothetical protein [Sphingomonas lycopersici]|uniref:SRPBCC family protein n=1 Tax=Sphingomonas lycopersici TaxID=2951807 RepID=A0AA41Z8L8_9SPHN|nr:hypothetical protein [Sphingomonas lycopersici]MCW6535972.1 hypothetical protein [Sphingomonas lycopersici]